MEIISNAQKEADLADQIVSRTYEVYSYDQNIENYEMMIAGLPVGDWPENLIQYQGMNEHDAAFSCPADLIDDLAQYQLRDRIVNLVKSEKVERAKVAAILDVLNSRLSGPNRDVAIQAAIARRETAINGG